MIRLKILGLNTNWLYNDFIYYAIEEESWFNNKSSVKNIN